MDEETAERASLPKFTESYHFPLTGINFTDFLEKSFKTVVQSPMLEMITQQVGGVLRKKSLARLREAGTYEEGTPDAEVMKDLDEEEFYRQHRFKVAEAVRDFILDFSFATDAVLYGYVSHGEGLSHAEIVLAAYNGTAEAVGLKTPFSGDAEIVLLDRIKAMEAAQAEAAERDDEAEADALFPEEDISARF